MLKKVIISFIIILIAVISVTTYYYYTYKVQSNEIQKINKDYESYYDIELLGTNIISIINKTINLNEKNGIAKNEKGEYQENDTNSIIVTVQFIGQNNEIFTYRMEAIAKQGTEAFVQNFGAITFKCTKIEYHEKTKMVKSLFIEQI